MNLSGNNSNPLRQQQRQMLTTFMQQQRLPTANQQNFAAYHQNQTAHSVGQMSSLRSALPNYQTASAAYQIRPAITNNNKELPPPPPLETQKPKYLPNRFREWAFHEFIAEVVPPTTLVHTQALSIQTNPKVMTNPNQEFSIFYKFTIEAINPITMNRNTSTQEYPIQLFARIGTYVDVQECEDHMPLALHVRVNSQACTLPQINQNQKPGQDPRRLARPFALHLQSKLSPVVNNVLTINWCHERVKTFAVHLYVAKLLTVRDLMDRLKRDKVVPEHVTKQRIVEKNKANDDDMSSSDIVTVVCPLGRCRMLNPGRGASCCHFQCFDAESYISINEKKPTWMCPVCSHLVYYSDLVIDGYFLEMVNNASLPSDVQEVELLSDGTWKPYDSYEDANNANNAKCDKENAQDAVVDSVELLSDNEDEDENPANGNGSVVADTKPLCEESNAQDAASDEEMSKANVANEDAPMEPNATPVTFPKANSSGIIELLDSPSPSPPENQDDQ